MEEFWYLYMLSRPPITPPHFRDAGRLNLGYYEKHSFLRLLWRKSPVGMKKRRYQDHERGHSSLAKTVIGTANAPVHESFHHFHPQETQKSFRALIWQKTEINMSCAIYGDYMILTSTEGWTNGDLDLGRG